MFYFHAGSGSTPLSRVGLELAVLPHQPPSSGVQACASRSEEICWMWKIIFPDHLYVVLFVATMFGRWSLPQLLFAGILGIAGGIYIYQPIFEQYYRDQKALKKKMELTKESEEKRS